MHAVPAEPAPPATVIVQTCNHCPYVIAWNPRLRQVAEDYARPGRALPGGQLERRLALPGRLARPHEAVRRRPVVADPIPLRRVTGGRARARRGRDAARLRLRLGPPARLPGRARLGPHRREPGRGVAARRARRRARGRHAGAAGDAAARLQRQVARLARGGPTRGAGRPPPPPAPRPRARTRAPARRSPPPRRSSAPTSPVSFVSGRSPIRAIASTSMPAPMRAIAGRPRAAQAGADGHDRRQDRDRNERERVLLSAESSRRRRPARGPRGPRRTAVTTSISNRLVTSARTIRSAAATPSASTAKPTLPLRLKRAWKAAIPLLESPTAFGSSRRLFTEGWRPRPHKAADPEATLRGLGPGRAFFLLQNRE